MTDYSPDKEGYNKSGYTEKQQYVLDNVITTHGGDPIAAAKAAGYKNPYEAVKSLATELVQLAEDVLARYAIYAAMTTGRIVEAEDVVPQANEKLRAAKDIMEHVKPKVTKLEHSGEVKGGVFILPDKRPMESDDEQD
jgi:hypothetical protein